MQLGMIGLGRMGANMTRRLLRGGHEVVVYDRSPAPAKSLASEGALGASSIEDLVRKLNPPRVAWLMVPAGTPTENTVTTLASLMKPGDIIVDGGNTFFKDDVRRSRVLREKELNYVDVGTSGGIWGRERGYCQMIGGDLEIVSRLDPIFRTLAPGGKGDSSAESTAELGYLHCGPAGAGHFVKMVHNGIEYGLMQAYAEGFEIMRRAGSDRLQPDFRFNFDLLAIAEVWRHGSLVGSWLLDMLGEALGKDVNLAQYSGFVQDSGEGRWAVQTAVEEEVPANVLTAALFTRFRSRDRDSFAEKVLSALRHQLGGHLERPCGG
jgi:6-phosphogluconate dehydrogenase